MKRADIYSDDMILENRRLRENLARLSGILDNLDELICRFTFDGAITFVNDALCRMSGKMSEELLGRDVFSLIKPRDRQLARELFNTIDRSNNTVEVEQSLTRANGELLWIGWQGRGIFNSEGEIIEYQAVGRNITREKQNRKGRKNAEEERARQEDQVRQSEKMEALGTLAGGIAHDLNSSLGIIVTNTEIALEDLPPEAPSRYGLELVLKASHRAMDLVKQILTFTRPSEEKMAAVRLGPIVQEAVKLVESSLSSDIKVCVSPPKGEDIALADQSQIHQVVLNLCTNAAWAMRKTGGVLNVSLEAFDLKETMETSCGKLGPGAFLKLMVIDTGQGMNADVLKRIFDPFFTTKGTGKGSGMGLSVVHGIVRAHQGGIVVSSQAGKGSCFEVYLPRLQSEHGSWGENAENLPKGTERILLVDDDEDMALVTQGLFKRLGYKTTALTGSLKALETFKQDPHGFDILVTDQVMPEMTGLELAREVQALRPDIPIILFTGFWAAGTRTKARDAGIRELLIKPIRNRRWAETVRRVLDQNK
ncbi:hybrid sensor histidine kinase/response regulator [Dethiosulfatarculus sandiegensis]|uniref:histidine kinase n=1 Tax=Dethiosulfatarculus sandiegensis TaxID=1429043 RepID=A0A0D2J5E2_9BACT|nr:ATP-binding protein [Dethiosulfatarculus sandiegensis]KIX10916.1 histidine kinase [Dethiosulfatarculus sandiegensis]